MNKWIELLAGLILVIVAAVLWVQNIWGFGASALEFLKGGVIWGIIGIGLLLLLLGITDLKE
ncbi:MAG: hypothetical protein AABX07_04140 [Nanoarchaeota archaeon]